MQMLQAFQDIGSDAGEHAGWHAALAPQQVSQTTTIHQLEDEVHMPILGREARVPLHQVWATLRIDEAPHLVEQQPPVLASVDLQGLYRNWKACGLDDASPHASTRAGAQKSVFIERDVIRRNFVLASFTLDTCDRRDPHAGRLVQHGPSNAVVGPTP